MSLIPRVYSSSLKIFARWPVIPHFALLLASGNYHSTLRFYEFGHFGTSWKHNNAVFVFLRLTYFTRRSYRTVQWSRETIEVTHVRNKMAAGRKVESVPGNGRALGLSEGIAGMSPRGTWCCRQKEEISG